MELSSGQYLRCKNKKYDDANKYVDEITKLDNNNAAAHKIKNMVLLEKARDSVNGIIGPELHAVYEEKESNINGREYFIFYEVSKDDTYSDRRDCVDKLNGEIFIQYL